MGDSRTPGRYNLHRLGWTAFEDLCMQIMRVVLGETCTRFRPGPDGGRDGWYEGEAAGKLATQDKLAGRFVVQCKHTSAAKDDLGLTDLSTEQKKITKLAASQGFHYILLTNRQITARSEKAIRSAFEAVPGVGRCILLGETWIEDTIDANPRLTRLVPRLYGIGDLSQIISFTIGEQTKAVLEDLSGTLRTFVPTESYRRAERAMEEHGFVVLVGPPASGKSAIAANLCMVNMAQDANVKVMRIERAEQFDGTWSPNDRHVIYWVDDVFGETTFDEKRADQWSAALTKVEAARKRGARILFCTRDYILAAAEQGMKRSKADIINDARVRVDVTNLTDEEKDSILYNHIKHGDLTKIRKSRLKPHLPSAARLESFSPELARRLGSQKLNTMVMPSDRDLRYFFEYPVRYFEDVIHGLSPAETAALAVCLLSNNSVPDPVPTDALADAVLVTYGVSMQEVRDAFEMLEGSFVKRVRTGTKQNWSLHHPSMIEALQEEMRVKSSQLLLYLQSAKIEAVFRDTTMLAPESNSRLVFLPDSVYPQLAERFTHLGPGTRESAGHYLAQRASDEFLNLLHLNSPSKFDEILSCVPDAEGDEVCLELAIRLLKVKPASLMTDSRLELLKEAMNEGIQQSGWTGFLNNPDLELLFPDAVAGFLRSEVAAGFPTFQTLYDWCSQDLSGREHVDAASEAVDSFCLRVQRALTTQGMLSPDSEAALQELKTHFETRLEERRSEIGDEEEARSEAMADEWKERRHEERYEMEHGRFSDVDE